MPEMHVQQVSGKIHDAVTASRFSASLFASETTLRRSPNKKHDEFLEQVSLKVMDHFVAHEL